MTDDNKGDDLLRHAIRLAFIAGREFGQREAERRIRDAVVNALGLPSPDTAFHAREALFDNATPDVRREARSAGVHRIIAEVCAAARDEVPR